MTRSAPLVLGLGLAAWAFGAQASEPPTPSVLVQTVPAARERMPETITAFGRVHPDPDAIANVAFPRAGVVNRLWVRLGQRVEPGQPLLELDTAPSARSDYQQALAAADFARRDAERIQRLFSQQLATRDQVAQAERNLKDAESKLEAQKRLGTNLPQEIVRAPFAGIVTELSVTQGQRVQADSTAMLLAKQDALVASLGLEQEDAVRAAPGMPVTLRSVLRPGAPVLSEVDEVHAMVDPQTRLVDALVRIPKTSAAELVVGATMQGEITLRQVDVLVVPRSAVLEDGQGSYVFVVEGHRARRVSVTRLLSRDQQVGITGGLSAGDQVVKTGNYELRDGMAVRETEP
jgi:RND family efflux transporter MFP subunit